MDERLEYERVEVYQAARERFWTTLLVSPYAPPAYRNRAESTMQLRT